MLWSRFSNDRLFFQLKLLTVYRIFESSLPPVEKARMIRFEFWNKHLIHLSDPRAAVQCQTRRQEFSQQVFPYPQTTNTINENSVIFDWCENKLLANTSQACYAWQQYRRMLTQHRRAEMQNPPCDGSWGDCKLLALTCFCYNYQELLSNEKTDWY